MKIKINVVDDIKESSIKDNDLTEYRNSIKPDGLIDPDDFFKFKEPRVIGNPVHPGDVLLIKVKDKLFKCEVENSETFREDPSSFSVNIYPLDKDLKAVLENSIYRRLTKKNYFGGILTFNMETQHDDTYWEIDFTKGRISFFPAMNEFKDFSRQPFTVVKFLTKSIPSSVVQDNDLTEYKPSIKPLPEHSRNVFNPSQAIGEPVENGDTFLIEAADKSFKCEIHETDDLFKNHQNLFSARIYPLDKDDVSIAYEDYFEVVLIFDQHVENHDHYVIDFTKGKISPIDYIPIIREDTPFTVTKFLAHSGKTSTVQDNDLTEYRNSIKPDDIKHPYFFKETRTVGNPVKAGDTLLIKAKDKLFKCEIEDSKVFSKSPNMFSVKVYPLDKDDKAALENNEYARKVLKENYLDGIIKFDMEIQDNNGDTYWEIDFTKGRIEFSLSIVDNFKDFIKYVPFTVVKFLKRSVPASTVQDAGIKFDNLENDISEDLNGEFSNLYYNCIDFTYLLEDYEKAIEEIIYNDEPSDEYDEDPKDREYKDYLEKVASCIPDIIYSLKDLVKEIKKI